MATTTLVAAGRHSTANETAAEKTAAEKTAAQPNAPTAMHQHRHEFVIVRPENKELVRVRVGDALQINAPRAPMLPANLDKSFALEYDNEYLRLIAKKPPMGKGWVAQEMYFVALQPGETRVTTHLRDAQQKPEKTSTYRILIQAHDE